MKQSYVPHPIDTGSVAVPPELAALGEQLARNTHEVWAYHRLREGWTWGESLDPEAKKHPNLVPYEELSEADKDYDRRTSMEAVKMMLALGYRLTKE